MKTQMIIRSVAVVAALTAATALTGCANNASGGGTSTDTGPIVIGGTFPFTGPLASYGALADGFRAVIERVNDEDGGINGRELVFETLDDAYDPSRGASNVRSLVQQKDAFLVVTFGGAPVVTRDYLEQQKVPQFAFAGLSTLSDVDTYTYTRSWWPDLELEGQVAATFLSDELGEETVSTLTINNDAGTDLAHGVADNAGDGYDVGETLTYEPTDTQVQNQINTIRSTGGGLATLVVGAAEIAMLQYAHQVGLDSPVTIYSGATSIDALLKPAGEAAVGVYAPLWLKDPADPQWAEDSSLADYRATIEKYGNGADPADGIVLNGYGLAEALVLALQTAPELTREGVLESWDNLPPTQLDVLLPGVELVGNPDTGRPVQSYQVSRFDGAGWEPIGDVISRSDLTGE